MEWSRALMEYKTVRNPNFLNIKNEEPVDHLVNRSTVSCYTSIFFSFEECWWLRFG